MEGIKYDEGKPLWNLLPWKQVEDIVKVLTRGKVKYSPDNWKKVEPYNDRYFAAAMRHLTAWHMGERLDPETGYPHLAHACCCLLFIMWKDDEKVCRPRRNIIARRARKTS